MNRLDGWINTLLFTRARKAPEVSKQWVCKFSPVRTQVTGYDWLLVGLGWYLVLDYWLDGLSNRYAYPAATPFRTACKDSCTCSLWMYPYRCRALLQALLGASGDWLPLPCSQDLTEEVATWLASHLLAEGRDCSRHSQYITDKQYRQVKTRCYTCFTQCLIKTITMDWVEILNADVGE